MYIFFILFYKKTEHQNFVQLEKNVIINIIKSCQSSIVKSLKFAKNIVQVLLFGNINFKILYHIILANKGILLKILILMKLYTYKSKWINLEIFSCGLKMIIQYLYI